LKENANKDNAKSIIPKLTNIANKYRVSSLMKIQRKENTATMMNEAQILARVFL
jgi:cytochrome c553